MKAYVFINKKAEFIVAYKQAGICVLWLSEHSGDCVLATDLKVLKESMQFYYDGEYLGVL